MGTKFVKGLRGGMVEFIPLSKVTKITRSDRGYRSDGSSVQSFAIKVGSGPQAEIVTLRDIEIVNAEEVFNAA